MTVLIVDDQVSVVSALSFGIDWDSIGVTKILKAYNVFEAKEIIRTHRIDVLLCDIEMPAEDGLQLYRWAISNHYDFECIFLTSHADFMYAKEALQLGSFDYILQPARYEDVQAAVKGALSKLSARREMEIYSSYGRLIKGKGSVLLDDTIGKWLRQGKINPGEIDRTLQKLKIDLSASSEFYLVFAQILSNRTDFDETHSDMFRYGLTNILTEVAQEYGNRLILVKYAEDTFALLLYPQNSTLADPVLVDSFLQNLIQICNNYYNTRIAFYVGNRLSFDALPQTVQKLQHLLQNNIMRIARVFHEDDISSGPSGSLHDFNYNHLETLAQQGNFSAVFSELRSYLDSLEQNQCFSLSLLRNFYSQFLQLAFCLLSSQSITMADILPESSQRDFLLNVDSFRSIPETRKALQLFADAFSAYSQTQKKDQDITKNAMRYIHENIEKDIRRSDLASFLHVSQDYISHIFKTETNISLTDYIIREKMSLARTLIHTTALPIGVIAAKVGYSNFSHFSKTYKRVFGLSPTSEKKNKT